MDVRYSPGPGRYGTNPIVAAASNVGALTANTTTTFFLALPPGKFFINKLIMTTNVVAADADGTVLATFQKYDGVANSAVALNTAADLETMTTKESTVVNVLSSLTDAQRIVNTANGDSIYVDVVNNSAALNTQPTNLCFAVELFQLN